MNHFVGRYGAYSSFVSMTLKLLRISYFPNNLFHVTNISSLLQICKYLYVFNSILQYQANQHAYLKNISSVYEKGLIHCLIFKITQLS